MSKMDIIIRGANHKPDRPPTLSAYTVYGYLNGSLYQANGELWVKLDGSSMASHLQAILSATTLFIHFASQRVASEIQVFTGKTNVTHPIVFGDLAKSIVGSLLGFVEGDFEVYDLEIKGHEIHVDADWLDTEYCEDCDNPGEDCQCDTYPTEEE